MTSYNMIHIINLHWFRCYRLLTPEVLALVLLLIVSLVSPRKRIFTGQKRVSVPLPPLDSLS